MVLTLPLELTQVVCLYLCTPGLLEYFLVASSEYNDLDLLTDNIQLLQNALKCHHVLVAVSDFLDGLKLIDQREDLGFLDAV